jgi:hypothetical protein
MHFLRHALLLAAPVILALYAVKWLLWRSTLGRPYGHLLFALALMLAWGAGCFLIVGWEEWNNPQYTASEYWLGPPLWLLPVPSLSYLLDWRYTPPSGQALTYTIVRHLIELVVLFPLWTVIQIPLAFVFGWFWI